MQDPVRMCATLGKAFYQVYGSLIRHIHCQYLQWFDRWTPLAGNDLHEFKAAVVELNVGGIVVLCVDLTGPKRTTVLRLDANMEQN